MKKRVILSAGGTGGHLFPAQSLAKSLVECELLFVAGGLESCRYFEREKFSFKEIPCSTFSLSQPLKLIKGSGKILQGVWQSRKIIRNFSPDVVIGFGSYFTLPVLIAAKMDRIPLVLHEQNAIPGKVNRLFSGFSHTTAITFPHSAEHLKGNVVEVKFPVRERSKKRSAWNYFGLEPTLPTLLVFGGSQGAVGLNTLFFEALSFLPSVQILHFTGKEKTLCYKNSGIKACVKEFEPHIDLAMEIADLAIVRAGAATIAELIEYELPAILIPFPFATENHQVKNSEHFVHVVGGGEMYLEKEIGAKDLALAITQMLSTLEEKKNNIREFKKTHQVKTLTSLIKDIIND